MSWQPIETAPKNAYILVWDEDNGVCVSCFGRGVTVESDEWVEGWTSERTDQRDEPIVMTRVTHWMPLPDAPTA